MKRLILMEGNTLARQRDAAGRGVRSPGGVYAETLQRLFPSIHVDVVNAAEPGDILPAGASLEDYDGLVAGGSALHAYDRAPEVRRQIDLVRSFAGTGKPILGSCWGLQLAVVAAGGEVALNPNGREIVFARKITLNAMGRAHPLFDGKPTTFDAPSIHYDEVRALPPAATILCSNYHSRIQGAIVPLGSSQVWAVQYHPEFDLRQVHDMVKLYGDSMIADGLFEDQGECCPMLYEPERGQRFQRYMSLNFRSGRSLEHDRGTSDRTHLHGRSGQGLPGRQRAGRLFPTRP